nr:FUSC family protein [Advenella alkanexedens]
MGAAFATRYVIHENHWFWVPLTIALTMKPDFGSVFARTLMRCLGTIFGACIGTVVLYLLPKGVALIVVIGILAALIPWAKMVSYATQVIIITAVLLLLLDLLSTGPMTVNYAGQRVIDTIIAGVIILVFNYFLWPQRKNNVLGKRFDEVLNAIKHYLKSACQSANGDEAEFQKITQEVFKAKIAASQKVSDLRTELHRLMLAPAPVGVEATSWFPLVAGAERLCDKITVYFIHRTVDSAPPASSDIHYLLDQIEHIQKHQDDGEQYSFSEKNTEQIKAFLFGLNEEITNLSKLLETNIRSKSMAGHEALA